MIRQPVTASLLHGLVAGSHAQGTTGLAVAVLIEDHDHILLIDLGCSWALPTDLVLPAEPLDDAVHRTASGVGIDLDDVTGYLGHHDLLTGDDVVRTFVFAATTHLGNVWHRTPRDWCRWAAFDDLPDDIDEDILRLVLAAAAGNDHNHGCRQPLPAALRAHAHGLLAAEAAVELLIGHRAWLHRHDFLDDYVDTTAGLTTGTPTACVNWPAAITALETGALPCSAGEARMLRIAASLAEGIPIDLRAALTGLDADNLDLVTQAVLHTGRH